MYAPWNGFRLAHQKKLMYRRTTGYGKNIVWNALSNYKYNNSNNKRQEAHTDIAAVHQLYSDHYAIPEQCVPRCCI